MKSDLDVETGRASLPKPASSLFAKCLQNFRGQQDSEVASQSSASNGNALSNDALQPNICQNNPVQGKNSAVESIKQIEDYPNGYPRFAALISAHDQLLVIRRFSDLHARLLLLAQDRLVELEEKLNRIDREEPCKVFLASSRIDKNENRKAVLSEIQEALREYDDLVGRTARMSQYHTPHPWHVQSLKNWLRGNAAIARRETKFLEHETDLASLARDDDGVIVWLENNLSRLPRWLQKILRFQSNISRDQNVHITPRTVSDRIVRIIIAPLVIVVLLVPVIICDVVTDSNMRLLTIAFSSYTFVLLLSLLTRNNTTALAIAGATYTAVLIVFISN